MLQPAQPTRHTCFTAFPGSGLEQATTGMRARLNGIRPITPRGQASTHAPQPLHLP